MSSQNTLSDVEEPRIRRAIPVEFGSPQRNLSLPNRPHLVAKADSIQSRLSQLAAALSPSHSLTPISRKEAPSPVSRPPIGGTPFGDSELPSRSTKVKHYPINTPPFEASEGGTALTDLVRDRLEQYLKDFQTRSSGILTDLRLENVRKEKIKNDLLHESAQREEEMLGRILSALSDMDVRSLGEELQTQTMRIVDEKIAAFRNAQAELRTQRTCEVGKAKMTQVTEALDKMEARMHAVHAGTEATENSREMADRVDRIVTQGLQSVERIVDTELDRMKDLGSARNARNLQTDPHAESIRAVEQENHRLRNLVRKMKIGLSKWRIDYLHHAQQEQQSQSSLVIRDDEPKANVFANDNFRKYSQTLAKMWTACGPSNVELVQFLDSIEHAVQTGTDLAHVYKNECTKNVEKLPLAQLAARREFLLSKPLSFDERIELAEVTENLESLVLEYEHKHAHSFAYDGVEYSTHFSRVDIRGT